jgi:hypothetical protein
MGHKGPVLRPRCIRPRRARTQIPFNSIQFKSYETMVMYNNVSDTMNLQQHCCENFKFYTRMTSAAALYSSLLDSCKCIGGGAGHLTFFK